MRVQHSSRWIGAIAGLTALLAGCNNKIELTAYGSCDELEEAIEALAVEEYVWEAQNPSYSWRTFLTPRGVGAAAYSPEATTSLDFTARATVPQAGLTEADFVAEDGEWLYLLHGGELVIVQAWPAEELTELSRLELEGYPAALFLEGDALAVVSYVTADPSPASGYSPELSGPATKLAIVDVADREAPVVHREIYVEGALTELKRIGASLHLITQRDLGLGELRDGIQTVDSTASEIREAAEEQSLESWMPARIDHTISGGDWSSARDSVSACGAIYRPGRDAGLAMVTDTVLDLTAPDSELESISVLAGFGDVTLSADTLHVAVAEPQMGPHEKGSGGYGTRIHRFDVTGGAPSYVASGRVVGTLAVPAAMDEQEGTLRVMTIRSTGNIGNGTAYDIRLLRQEDGELVETDAAEDVLEGGWLESVRFIDDRAYVGLHTSEGEVRSLSLSALDDPWGGSSMFLPSRISWLHPVVADHLLAVSRSSNPDGVQLGLYDVASANNVEEVAGQTVRSGWAGAGTTWDAGAVLYNEPLDLLVFPGNEASSDSYISFAGLYLYDVSPEEGMAYMGKLDTTVLPVSQLQSDYRQQCAQVQRAVIIDDILYAVGAGGVVAAPLMATEEPLGVVAFDTYGWCDTPQNWY